LENVIRKIAANQFDEETFYGLAGFFEKTLHTAFKNYSCKAFIYLLFDKQKQRNGNILCHLKNAGCKGPQKKGRLPVPAKTARTAINGNQSAFPKI
jgi:hypothetical protein